MKHKEHTHRSRLVLHEPSHSGLVCLDFYHHLPGMLQYAFSGRLFDAVLRNILRSNHLHMFHSALELVGLESPSEWTANWKRIIPRTFTLDAISVRNFLLYILLIPALRPDIWMLQLVVVIAEDVL